MNNMSYSDIVMSIKEWSPVEGTKQVEQQNRFVQWWHNLTALPDVPANASFVKRETARKSRLFSTVMFFYTLVVIIFLPCCLFLPQRLIFWIDAFLIILSIFSLVLNRKGRTLIAAMMIVAAFQLALTTIIFVITPFDENSLQIYDLFIMTELLAVSLLPPRSVFLVATINSAVIMTSILYQPHTPLLDQALETQLIPAIARPVGLQFIIAGVAYAWVHSMIKAIIRADRAEMIASLEHALVEQKRELEMGIQQILQTHVAVANGNLNARAPLTQDNMLWQIARALNTLLIRLQRASIAEKELYRVEQAVTYSVSSIQLAEQQQQLPQLAFTHTAIDPLVAALQGKKLAFTQSPFLCQIDSQNSKGEPNFYGSIPRNGQLEA